MDFGLYQTFLGYAMEGNREAHRFTLSNAYKDLRYLESMANAATVTTTMASAAKNSFAGSVARGGVGPEYYVPHLVDFWEGRMGLISPLADVRSRRSRRAIRIRASIAAGSEPVNPFATIDRIADKLTTTKKPNS